MKTPVYTTQFKRDFKKMKKRGKDEQKLRQIAEKLLVGQALDSKHRNHLLVGNYIGRNECHIEPDWLLIYKLEESRVIFERTGTHTDLFN
jgi:mRNA interferase YafQ